MRSGGRLDCRDSDIGQNLRGIRRAQARARVPSRSRRICTEAVDIIAAARDVAEDLRTRRIQFVVYEAEPLTEFLVQSRDQAGPQRCDGACPADDNICTLDVNSVPGLAGNADPKTPRPPKPVVGCGGTFAAF